MQDAIPNARSLLFAPATDERKLAKALRTGADAVIADLEDAVAPGEKDRARQIAARMLAPEAVDVDASARIVRINGIETSHWERDLAVTDALELDAIMLPKATPEAVAALGPAGPPVIAIVETAIGLKQAFETARCERVVGLALGGADLGAELRLEPRADGLELLHARSQLVLDSAAAGIRAPFDVVHLDTRDTAGLESESRLARSLGLGGKLCIHPEQIATVNRAFGPDERQLAWARAAIAAYEDALREGRGAASLEGQMIDAPVVERARSIVASARKESA